VLLPLLLLYSSHQQIAVGMAVGALLISLTDLPGNRRSKMLTAVQSLSVILVTSVVFALCLPNPLLTGIALTCFTFLWCMLAALGPRSTGAGAMGIALMVFMLGLRPHQPLTFSLLILLGGAWFYLVSLAQVFIWPFRSLHQALREVLAATAGFLEARALCYDPAAPLEESYRRTIAMHLRVSDKQEVVRNILLSDRSAMRNSGTYVKSLLNISIKAIGLYEQVTAAHYDYVVIRERLASSGVLSVAAEIIRLQAREIKWLSNVVPLSKQLAPPVSKDRYDELIASLKTLAAGLPNEDAAVINGFLINADAVFKLLETIRLNKIEDIANADSNWGAFLPRTANFKKLLLAQLHFRSPVLRFSLRLTLLFVVGYCSTLLFVKDAYGYWLLLTILIVSRPRLALTWQRNLERLVGTVVGVIAASLLLLITQSAVMILPVAALALTGFFTWNRNHYSRSVCCVTLSVVLCLSIYHGQPIMILSARIAYTIAGCALAFAGIFVFPVWVGSQLNELARLAVEGNRQFLAAVLNGGETATIWLARKEAHLRLARFSEGLRHARVEPGKFNLPRLEHVQVLNYRINSVIISLALSPRRKGLSLSNTSPQRILQYLDGYGNGNGLQPTIKTPAQKAAQPLLKGMELLEALAFELSGYNQ